MFKYTTKEVNKIAQETNFNKNTVEKVLRLYSILNIIQNSEFKDTLALKGGTAINLFLFDLPRLSVDIDLDFNLPVDKETMFSYRTKIDSFIKGFMESEGYHLSVKSKFLHTLDSYVYSYQTTSNNNDVLKIEINYSDRVHVLKSAIKESTKVLGETSFINVLADEELIGSKINAMICRTMPRDVYDVFNLFKTGKIKDKVLIRKITIFYLCLSIEMPIDFESILHTALEKIDKLNYHRIKETLLPLLHKGIKFNVIEVTSYVSNEIKNMFLLDDNDKEFIHHFNNKVFIPNVLFSGYQIENISSHPMALWKIR